MWLNEQTAFCCMQPDRLRLHLNVVCSFHDTHTQKKPPPPLLFAFNFLQGWSTYMLPFSFKREVYQDCSSNNESLFPLCTHLEIRRSAQGSILREYGKIADVPSLKGKKYHRFEHIQTVWDRYGWLLPPPPSNNLFLVLQLFVSCNCCIDLYIYEICILEAKNSDNFRSATIDG